MNQNTLESTPATPATSAPAPQTDMQRLRAAFEAAAVPPEQPAAPAPTETPAAPPTEGEPKPKAPVSSDVQKARVKAIREAQEKRDFAKQRDQLAAQLKEHETWKAAVERKDVWTLLKLAGFSKPEEFTAALTDRGPTTQAEIDAAAARKEVEELKRQQAAILEQQRLDSAKQNILNFLNTDDNFELARIAGADLVMEVANELAQKFQQENPHTPLPDAWELVRRAATQVEKYEEARLEKAAATKKMKAKFGASAPQPTPQAPSAPREPPRTISGKMSAVTAPSAEMSDEDRQKWVADELKKMFVR